jgi:Mg-chelatase subunit ChlD
MTKRILAVLLLSLLAPAASAVAAPTKAVKKLKGMAGQLAGQKGFMDPEEPAMIALVGAIEAVGAQDDAEAAKILLTVMAIPYQSASVEVTVAENVTEALTNMTNKGAHDEVRKALLKGKKNPNQVSDFAEIVGAWQEAESAVVLAELVGSKNPQIVMAGARGLGNLKKKEGVQALIDVFGAWQKRGGEPINVIGQALYDITGQAMTVEADWKKWWKSASGDWDASKRHGATGTATSEKPKHFQPPGDPAPEIFSDLRVTSKKVVIIMDTSGSMHIRQYVEEEVPPTEGGVKPEAGGDKGGGVSLGKGKKPKLKEDPNKEGYKPKKCRFAQCPGARGTGRECPSDEKLPIYYSRMKRLTRHMCELVDSLRSDVEFQLIAFSTDARAWKGKKLIKASAKNKAKAIKWLKGLSAAGYTTATKAIDLAFKIPGADTFVFCTDGGPTNPSGRTYPNERFRELLDEVKRQNRKRKVVIDVVAIAEGHTDFSCGLADESGGEYVVVD